MDIKTLSNMAPWEWPEGAADLLLSVLKSDAGDDADRLLAVRLAGDMTVMNDDIADALLTILRDPAEPETVRSAAAISLGPVLEEAELWADELDDPDTAVSANVTEAIRDGLRGAYLDGEAPKEVRRRALEAAVRGRADWLASAVRAAYHSGDGAWKLTAVFCMAHVAGFDREIVEALGSDDPEIRYEAVRAAGTWGVDAAWPHVRALVLDDETDKPLLLAAIDAAAGIRPGEAAELLGDLMESEDEEVADAVFEALAMAGKTREDLDDE